MLGGCAPVKLYKFGAVSMSPVESRVEGCHEGALVRPHEGVDPDTAVKQELANVEVTMEGRDVKGCFPILRGDVYEARPTLGQPFNELQPTGSSGFVANPRSPDGARLKRCPVLRQDLQTL
jgi:hypothetical protein